MATQHSHCEHHSCEQDMSQYEMAFSKYSFDISDERVSAFVKEVLSDVQGKIEEEKIYPLLFSSLELTSLNTIDSPERVLRWVEQVNNWYEMHPDFPLLAALCVYPNYVKLVAESLDVADIKVVSVAAAFPSAQTFLEVKTIETALALQDGAEEVDVVLPIGAFLSGDYESCADEISELKAICREKPLKVILETGLLKEAVLIKKAAIFAMYAGADFVKTSSGKIGDGASLEAVLILCTAIKEYEEETGRRIGLKVAGGVKTVGEALDYYTIVRTFLGEDYIKQGYFRIGASALGDELASAMLMQAVKPFSL